MSPLRTVLLVASREVRQRLRSKLFVWSTVVLSVLLTGVAAIPLVLSLLDRDSGQEPAGPVDPVVVLAVGEASPAEHAALASVLGEVDLRVVDDLAAARVAIAADEARLAIVPGERVLVHGGASPFDPASGQAAALAEALATAAVLDGLGVGEQAPQVLGAGRLEVERVGEDPESAAGRFLVANLGVVFLFGILVMYASMIVNGVIEEKGSRVVELLVEAVPVSRLLSGKLLGLGVIGLGQTLLLFGPATLVLLLSDVGVVPAGVAPLVGWLVLWFVLGYTLYSVLAAGLGALVSRPEEAQAVLTPANLAMIAGYLVAFVAIQVPDALVSRIAAIVPFSSPFVMLVRQTVGDPAPWEVVLALALLVVTIVGATLLAARIYRGGILRVGARVRLRDAWRDPGV